MWTKSLSLLLAALSLAGCASLQPAAPSLPAEVRTALDAAGIPESALGVVAFALDAPDQGLRLQAERAMQPGSAMKLVTAIVALDRLGPHSRGRSELLAEAAPQGERLPGPLYLRGGADSDLDWGALSRMLRQLREQGVREIQGGLVVDRELFNPARADLGAAPFDEAPEFPYNVIPDALNLNGQLLRYLLQSDGERVQARAFPAWPGMRIDTSRLTLNERACKDWERDWRVPELGRDAGGVVVMLQGGFPKHCRASPELNLVDRQWLAAQSVRQLWRELGGVIEGPDREAATPAGAVVLASHQGRPLIEDLVPMMKRSDNALTRLTYLRLGAAAAAPGEPTAAAAERVVRAWFAEQGIADQGLVLDNGSGLSRSERATPAQLAGVLQAGLKSPWMPEFLSSLPIAATDGTMRRRLKDSPAAQRARLKTGSLKGVIAIAGYVQDASNQPCIVVAILNDEHVANGAGRAVLDTLVDWVARN